MSKKASQRNRSGKSGRNGTHQHGSNGTNGVHRNGARGKDASAEEEEADVSPTLRIHVARLPEESLFLPKGRGKTTYSFGPEFLKTMKFLLEACNVKGGKVRLVGPTSTLGSAALGAALVHFQPFLAKTRPMTAHFELCDFGRPQHLAAAVANMEFEFSRTDHLIVLVGSVVFEEMLDEFHDIIFHPNATIKKGVDDKKPGPWKMCKFNEKEARGAAVVTFQPMAHKYEVRALTS